MLVDEVSKQLDNLVNYFIFWKNLVKSLLMYVTKCIAGAILKNLNRT